MLHRSLPSPARLPGSHRPAAQASLSGSDHAPTLLARNATTVEGKSDIDTLIEWLQRPDAQASALELHLPVHSDAKALARALAMLDEWAEQGLLTALTVTADEPVSDGLRLALAGSKACLVLSGATVRPLLFRDLANVVDHVVDRLHAPNGQALRQALDAFLKMDMCKALAPALDVAAASLLARIAVETGEDALLRAASVLSPNYQWPFVGMPDPQLYARLSRLGVPCSLSLELTCATAQTLIDWLDVPQPCVQAVDIQVVESLDTDTSMPLWTRLAGQRSIQRVEVDIARDVTIDWAPRTEPARAPTTGTHTLRIRLHDAYDAPPAIVAALMEWFQPMRLDLRALWVPTAARMLEAIEDPLRQRTLDSLHLSCETAFGAGGLLLAHALSQFLRRFDRVRHVVVRVQHELPSEPVLRTLNRAATQSLQLSNLELERSTPSHWQQDSHWFSKPLRLGLKRGRFFHAYVVGCTAALLRHVLGTDDPLGHVLGEPSAPVVREEEANTWAFRSLGLVSSDMHRAGIEYRRQAQALVLVDAMRHGLLDPTRLRELLMGPSGQLDIDLVTAVFQHLCEAKESEGVWRLFDEATAFH